MRRLPDFGFSEKFDDSNEADHNVGQLEVLDAIFEGEAIYVSSEYRRGKARRKILCFTNGLYLTVIMDTSRDVWSVLSAFPSSEADKRRFRKCAILNPNMIEEGPVEVPYAQEDSERDEDPE
jgi:hypothetical protein